MERDKHVAVVTDSGSSMLSSSPEARELGVTVVPLDIEVWNGREFAPYTYTTNNVKEFYDLMRTSSKLPFTSGSVLGQLSQTFENLRQNHESIVSINITSKHSTVYDSALLARDNVLEKSEPETQISVIDSKFASIATWFSVETAALNSKKGANIEQIRREIDGVIANTDLIVTLKTLENLIKGGRGKKFVEAVVASVLKITPIIGFENGEIVKKETARTLEKARQSMIDMVGGAGRLARVAVIHTNAIETAEKIKASLTTFFSKRIPIYEAGPALAVHAGEGAVGIAFQKA